MERILSAPRWALVAVVATFTLAVAALVTGLSGSAHAATPQTAVVGISGENGNGGDNNGQDCTGNDNNGNDNNGNNNDNNGKDNNNEDCDHTPKPTKTTETTPPPTTVTTTVTETTTTTTTSPSMTALPVTGSSSSGGGVLALVGAGMLMAGGVGMFGLRRLRDRRG